MAPLVITPEIEAAAQRLAERDGMTPTEAVAAAVQEKLNAATRPGKNIQKAREILARIHALPVDMSLTEDEILGYDEYGVPEQPYLDH